jgi:glycosyltransferase involved in cell wall biosynthesis
MSDPALRVLFSCCGVGIYNRGIESFFRDAFTGLRGTPGLECHLVKGGGEAQPDETVALALPRTGWLAPLIGRLTGRNAYVAEQWSSFPHIVWEIRRLRPDVIYYSDSNLGFLLYWFRRQIGVPYRLLFSNGGPLGPPFIRTDGVQQITPYYLEEALAAGEPPERHFFVPYGFTMCPRPQPIDAEARRTLRAKLGLPADRPVVLSVGWISHQLKRMDVVVEEIARLPEPRPFLQLLGAMDETSTPIIENARRLLGEANFSALSLPYEQVAEYYRAADCFVLASLKEGFGRVYLEAQMHGLPVVAHRHPVIEYVVGNEGVFGDLTRPGELAALVAQVLATPPDDAAPLRRWQSVKERFSWEVLAPRYREMFQRAAKLSIRREVKR